MKTCNNAHLSFLISNLILNGEVTQGSIIDVAHIKDFCEHCSEEEIISALDCFYKYDLVNRADTYRCKDNAHTFIPTSDDLETGYLCSECINSGIDEDDTFIAPHEFNQYKDSVTYRATNFSDRDIWTARSYYVSNDFDKAVSIIYNTHHEELKDIKDSKTLAEKISPYISSVSGSAVVTDKILPAVEMLLKGF